MADGALPEKIKLLMAMALDAAAGDADGVKSLAERAIKAGATKEEVAESLRVAQYVSGVRSTYTAGRALADNVLIRVPYRISDNRETSLTLVYLCTISRLSHLPSTL